MKLGIFGAGSLGKEVYDLVLCQDEKWEEIFYIDDVISERICDGIKVYRYDEMRIMSSDEVEILIASGEPYYREKMISKIENDGYRCAVLVSNRAYVAYDCVLEPGSIIFPNTYIGRNVHIGKNVIVHAGARIEGNCSIGNNTFVSSGAFVGADTLVEQGSFVGPNSALKDHINVGEYAVIGMGAIVNNNINREDIVVGNPARFLRKNESKKIFGYSSIE